MKHTWTDNRCRRCGLERATHKVGIRVRTVHREGVNAPWKGGKLPPCRDLDPVLFTN